MASKSLPRWNASASFQFEIDDDFRDSLLDGLSRNELCLGINISVNGHEYGNDLYPDDLADGSLSFELEGENHVRCKIEGSFEIDFTIDGDENQKILDANAPAFCLYLGDPDGNFHDPVCEEGNSVLVGELATGT